MSEETIPQTSEEKLRRAKTPGDFFFVVASMIGEGRTSTEIVSSLVDAKIEDSQLPEGADREMIKKGIVSIWQDTTRLLTK